MSPNLKMKGGFLVFLVSVTIHFNLVECQTPGFFDPFSVHILETYQGIEPEGIECRLFKKSSSTNQWILIKSRLTNGRGRASNFIDEGNFTIGTYKFWFDSGTIYRRAKVDSLLPYVEVTFNVDTTTEFYHIPVVMSPYHVTTSRAEALMPPNPDPQATTPAHTPNPFGSIVYDTAIGQPVANMRGDLYRFENGAWKFLVSRLTSSRGSYRNLFNDSCNFIPGRYKISFDTKTYWNSIGIENPFNPTVDLILEFEDVSSVIWVPVNISPFGYSFYKRGGDNGVPCLNRPTIATTTTTTSTIRPNPPNNNGNNPRGLLEELFAFLGLG